MDKFIGNSPCRNRADLCALGNSLPQPCLFYVGLRLGLSDLFRDTLAVQAFRVARFRSQGTFRCTIHVPLNLRAGIRSALLEEALRCGDIAAHVLDAALSTLNTSAHAFFEAFAQQGVLPGCSLLQGQHVRILCALCRCQVDFGSGLDATSQFCGPLRPACKFLNPPPCHFPCALFGIGHHCTFEGTAKFARSDGTGRL